MECSDGSKISSRVYDGRENPGNEPLIFLAFNINPEGVAAVLPGAPAKNQ
jgi:hypothetical protein